MDEHGIPLSIVVTGANRHDVTQVEAVLDGRILPAPEDVSENLCADAGYTGANAKQAIEDRGMTAHVRPRGEEKKAIQSGYKARRWIVEVAHSWFNRFRKILVRYEKKAANYAALCHLTAAVIAFRKIGVIYG